MYWPSRHTIGDIAKACALWLGLGLSLGFYYTFTYYGRSGWPMPMPEPCAALILYYFSVLNTATWVQALHWMLVFPLAGILWVTALTVTAPFFGGKRTEYLWTLVRFSVTCVPLLLPLPVMAYLAGSSIVGFSFRQMIDVALRHATYSPPSWLTPLYVGLAIVGLVWQIFVYAKLFELTGKMAVLHYLVSAILLVLLTCGAATLAVIPVRYWLGI